MKRVIQFSRIKHTVLLPALEVHSLLHVYQIPKSLRCLCCGLDFMYVLKILYYITKSN